MEVDVYNVLDVDTTKPWQVLSHYFPDKVGGKPAWLSLKPLPPPDLLKCGNCGKPCSFLLQKYSPTETLHRMIFVFVCRDPVCCRQESSDSFVVLRSQLAFNNDFYPDTSPDEDYFDMSSDYPRASRFTQLCVVCGCAGPKLCGKCHKAAYCSKEHQTSHWRAGHKSSCGQPISERDGISVSDILFEEFVLDIPDDMQEYGSYEKDEVVNDRLCHNWHDTESHTQNRDVFTDAALEEAAGSSVKMDKQFNLFKEAASSNPCQVLRYSRGGTPLWVTDHNLLQDTAAVPCCENCGAARHFEFQVMPQLLNYMHVDRTGDSIDWATLVVYTCAADCDIGTQYTREYLWKQDFACQH